MTRMSGLPCTRWCWGTLAGLILTCAALAFAQSAGDANCDGIVDPADLVAVTGALFTGSTCAAADVNSDHAISVADLSAEVGFVVQAAVPTATATPAPTASPTSSPTASVAPTVAETPTVVETPTGTATPTGTETPTVTATPATTVTPSPTSTPTLGMCPTAAADLLLTVDNRSGNPLISVTVSGRRLDATCVNAAGLDENYAVFAGAGSQTVGNLAPGRWVHTLTVQSTGQRQHLASLVLANPGSNLVRFTAVASVVTVSNTNDAGPGSLRAAVNAANAAPAPARIQFDEDAFVPGIPTMITLAGALPVLSASGVTLDGIDSTGAAGNRGIDAAGQPIGGLAITGASNAVIGMRVRNTGGNNRDVVSITGPSARANVIDQCIIEQSGTADGIGIDAGAGTDFLAGANVVRDSDISAAADKGIKVTTNAYARIERNRVHDNANGGIQSTLSGHVFARDNLVESNRGSTAQNGFSANGPSPTTPSIASELITDGNLSRFNGSDGISIRGASLGYLNNDALLANDSDGLRIFDENGSAAAAVQGVTAACNGVDGASVADSSQADFGGGPFESAGNNAFTQNNLPGGAANLRNRTGLPVYAQNAQWEHCGHDTECAIDAIDAYDVSDHGANTRIFPAQAHRSVRPPVVTAARPRAAQAGELMRIFGSGFNVIDGYAADAACPDVAARNRCTPLRGNCVRINNVPASIEAVTPTMLMVRLPFTCVEPQPLTVETQGGGVSPPFTVCTEAGE